MIPENKVQMDKEPKCIHSEGHSWRRRGYVLRGYYGGELTVSYCVHCGVLYRVDTRNPARDQKIQGGVLRIWGPADTKSSIWVLRHALEERGKSISAADRAAYDWAVSVITDFEGGYDDITGAVGYIDPRNMVGVLRAIYRIMPFFQAAEALGSGAHCDGFSFDLICSVYFYAYGMTENDVLERIGDRYNILWAESDMYRIVLADGRV